MRIVFFFLFIYMAELVYAQFANFLEKFYIPLSNKFVFGKLFVLPKFAII